MNIRDIRHESDIKRAKTAYRRITSALRRAGITLAPPPKNRSYGVDTLIDRLPSKFRIEQVGIWPAEGAKLRVVFGPAGWQHGHLYVNEKKTGFDVPAIVSRVQAYIASERERLAVKEERERIHAENQAMAKRLRQELGIDTRSQLKIGGAVAPRQGVDISLDLDGLTASAARAIATKIQKALPAKLLRVEETES